MAVKRFIEMFQRDDWFDPGFSLFVNRSDETFEMSEHYHDFIEITYITEGTGMHHIDGKCFPVKQGDIFFIPIGTSHVFRPVSADPQKKLTVYNCIFYPELLERLLSFIPGSDPILEFYQSDPMHIPWIKVRDDGDLIHNTFHNMHKEYIQKKQGFAVALHGGLLQLLVFLHRQWTTLKDGEDKKSSPGLDRALEYIRNNYNQPLSVADAAAIAGVCERQFHRLFKKHTGQTVTGYIQSERIAKSRDYLKTTSMKIQEIAAAVGYRDMKFYNRLFKKITGLTPREYRMMP